MRSVLYLTALCALSTGCTTLDQSFRLGAVTGTVVGASATLAAGHASGRTPRIEEVGVSASIGLGLGLLASYLVHQSVVEDREAMARKTEIYFGDLPPSPFIIPTPPPRSGGRR
jgi:hypothetical protein